MKKTIKLSTIIFIVAIGIIFFHTNITSAQQVDDIAEEFFDKMEEVLTDNSLVTDEATAEAILNEKAENLSDEINAERLDHDEVSRIVRESGIFEQLGEVEVTLPDGTQATVDLTPGAVVYKWDKVGKVCSGPHKFNIKTWAKVNQWIKVSVGKTKIAWKVFKPGKYYTDCMYLNIHSNGTLTVELENKGPLLNVDGSGVSIPTAYAISDFINTPQDAVYLNDPIPNMVPSIIDWVVDGESGEANNLPKHAYYKIWNSISVSDLHPPGLYTTDGESAILTVIAEM